MIKYNPGIADCSNECAFKRELADAQKWPGDKPYVPNMLVIDKSAFSGCEEIAEQLKACVEADDYWRSYDPNNHNFHIVPNVDSSEAFREIAGALGCNNGHDQRKRLPHTYAHRYSATETIEGYDYFYSFNRLVVNEEKKTVSNHLGKMQIYRVMAGLKGPNFSEDRSFKMMYPTTAEDEAGRFDNQSGHFVYNAPLTIADSKDDIDEAFKKFIEHWNAAK